MTTATTSTVIDHTSDAGFRTWVAEVIAQLLAVGLTQTADTGQINTATVTRPGTSTSGGYAIFRFNDTAQATSPVFIKLEFGTNTVATTPAMWITVANGSNGAGTLTGLITTRVIAANSTAPSSTVTLYVSRFMYNTTAGACGMVWKINGGGNASQSLAGFIIFRSNDGSGVVTTDSVHLLTNSNTASSAASSGFMQVISYLSSLVYNTGAWPSSSWGKLPFKLTATVFGGNVQVGPCFQYTPVMGITNWLCLGLLAEIGIGTSFVFAILGATTHTFLQVGYAVGTTDITADNLATTGICMLWE